MPGRHQHLSGLGTRSRWTAGAIALSVAGTAAAVALIPAGAAAAKTPRANYHSGSDKAVFTVTGVEDSNCLLSTGGTTVFIKPGDRIDFSSALAGVSLNGLNLQGGQVAGLNVRASIDGGSAFAVAAGKTVKVKHLGTGTHTLAWSANSVGVAVPSITKTVTKLTQGLLGKVIKTKHQKVIPAHTITVPLSSGALKSGAQLSWTGKIHVTKSAPVCKISVQTPKAKVSVGPAHVTLPGHQVTVPGVTVPTSNPSVPDLAPTSGASSSGSGTTAPSSTPPSYDYTPPALTVPEQVVPQGDGANVYGGGGYDLGLGADSGGGSQLSNLSLGSGTGSTKASGGGATSTVRQDSTGKSKTIDLASAPQNTSNSVTAQLPVLLAILAVIALAVVSGTYARLYLLGRKN